MPTPPAGELRGDVRIVNRDRAIWGTPTVSLLTLINQLVRRVAIASAAPAVWQLRGGIPIVDPTDRTPTTAFLTGLNQLLLATVQAGGTPAITQIRGDVAIVETTGCPTRDFLTAMNQLIQAVALL